MKKKIANIEEFVSETPEEHKPLLLELMRICRSTDMTESIKWNTPCYAYKGNVCSIGVFKESVGMWFFKGALLDDPKQTLKQNQSSTKALRSLKFHQLSDIDEAMIRQFIQQAIQLNEKGKMVEGLHQSKALIVPPILQDKLNADSELAEQFKKLSKSKQREFAEWISEAKRADTVERRLGKSLEMIKQGIGLNDKYR